MAAYTAKEKDLVLRIVINELATVSYKWYKIGIQLGFQRHVLKQFEKDDDPLSAVVDSWLKGNADPEIPISWSSIVNALKTKSVAEVGLGEEISAEHCVIKRNGLQAQPIPLPRRRSVKPTPSPRRKTDRAKPTPLPRKRKSVADIEMDLKFILEKNLKSILLKFSAYMECIKSLVKSKGVCPKDLRSFVLSLPAFTSSNSEQRLALVSEKRDKIINATTINEIFDFLNMECSSFLNYDIFECIMNKYDLREDREELNYADHLKDYIEKHKISEFIKVNSILGKRIDGSEKLILKYNVELTCKLAKIVELKNSLAEILDLTPSALEILDVKDGCVVVTFLISTAVADAIFNKDKVFTSTEGERLQAASILWLECNGRTFHFEEEQDSGSESYDVKMQMDQLVTCSVCLGTFTDPKLLQCLHAFCLPCLERLMQQQEDKSTLPCPTCRKPTLVPSSGVAGLPVDFRTNQLLEFMKKSWKKLKTGNFMSRMASDSYVVTPLASAEESTVDSVSNIHAKHSIVTLRCQEHAKNELAIFCETCSEAICLKCIKKKERHNDHDWEELDEVIERYKEQEIPMLLEMVHEALTKLNTSRDELHNQRAAIEAEILDTDKCDLEKTKLIGHLHELTQMKVKDLSIQQDQFETTQIRLDNYAVLFEDDKEMRRQISSFDSVKKLLPALQLDLHNLSTLVNMIFLPSSGPYGQISTLNLPDPTKCYATGDGIEKAVIGRKSTVIVHVMDSNNQIFQQETSNFVTCELILEIEGSKLTGSVEMRETGQYYISYSPTIDGHSMLHIKVRGQHIKGSPFSVNVEDPIQPMTRPRGVVFTSRYNRSSSMVSGWKIPKSLIVSTRDLELGAILGQGEFGVVYKGWIKKNSSKAGQAVAVKTQKGSFKDEFVHECKIMHKFDHPNVMKLSGVWIDESSHICIVMPFMANGNLKDHLINKWSRLLHDQKSASPFYSAFIGAMMLSKCLDIAKGMEYITSKRVVHRDLAARNCMVDVNFAIKISDFGLSVSLESSQVYHTSESSAKLPIKWLAPESMAAGMFSEKTDVWSFGVTCWEIFSGGASPYPDILNAAIPYYLEKGHRLERPYSESCNEEIYLLMRKCWNFEASLRPTFTEIVKEVDEILKNVQHLKYQQQLKNVSEIHMCDNIAYGVLPYIPLRNPLHRHVQSDYYNIALYDYCS